MAITSLNCPNCGAPLQLRTQQTLVVCLYCDSTLRLHGETPSPQVDVEATLAAEEMEQLKQLLLTGKQEEAVNFYRQQNGSTLEEAQAIINDLGRQLTLKTVLRQQLSPFGVVIVIICLLLLLVSSLAGIAGVLHPLIVVGLAGFALLQLLVAFPAMHNTLKFWRATIAPARILKLAPIGRVKMRGTEVYTFKVLLEVRPEGDRAFQAEILIPVRAKNLTRFHVGTVFQVKYLADDSTQLIFHKEIKQPQERALNF